MEVRTFLSPGCMETNKNTHRIAMDPLRILPVEIVLRIIDFSPISTIPSLIRLTKGWQHFIEKTHKQAIYHSKADHPPGTKDFGFLEEVESYDKYFEGLTCWKKLCKRQKLLEKNWDAEEPLVDQTLLTLAAHTNIWRFRADLRRRFVLCTTEVGGLEVIDLDGKGRLWYREDVPPYAHLEYSNGMGISSTLGESLEVWTTGHAGKPRGYFEKIAVLDCPTMRLRGFHLAFETLCVVGDDGCGLVYDMSQRSTQPRTTMRIPDGAVGHLCQEESVVMYSIEGKSFDFYDKTSGERLGVFRPNSFRGRRFHILEQEHGKSPLLDGPPAKSYVPLSFHDPNLITPLEIQEGPHPSLMSRRTAERDAWGAGLLSGSLMVGISAGGRVLICSDWPEVLRNPAAAETYTYVIECSSNTVNFDMGGWLSVRDNRVLFEIRDSVYLLQLDEDGFVPRVEQTGKNLPSWSWRSTLVDSASRGAVSLMALFDDCILATSTIASEDGTMFPQWDLDDGAAESLPSKGLRILSLAPSLDMG